MSERVPFEVQMAMLEEIGIRTPGEIIEGMTGYYESEVSEEVVHAASRTLNTIVQAGLAEVEPLGESDAA